MQERALRCFHRLEAQSLLLLISGKNAEFSFVLLRELGVLAEESESLRGVGYEIVSMGGGIDIKC